jgi:glycosyltransferase involved in cell wall biosynthesis
LNIAITADPELPVPPKLYGGIERIIAMLIDGYIAQGHQVSLFAHRDSVTPAKLYPYPGKTNTLADSIKNTWLINKTLFSARHDIVHSFGRLAYITPQLPLAVPKLMSYQREPTISQVKKAVKLAKKGSLAFTGCSDYISRQILPFAPSYTIYNGVDADKYQFKEQVSDDAPLVFLGRIEPIKGAHVAIEIAQKTSRKLVIAGNIPDGQQQYFAEKIAPYLNDSINYIGAVNDEQKNQLLGQAAAFLMPILWNEPFGIVMTEAMACGTPVIGFNGGAVPEIVEHQLNGFYGAHTDDLIKYVAAIKSISRKKVREHFEQKFAKDVIVNNYLSLYRDLISRQ